MNSIVICAFWLIYFQRKLTLILIQLIFLFFSSWELEENEEKVESKLKLIYIDGNGVKETFAKSLPCNYHNFIVIYNL